MVIKNIGTSRISVRARNKPNISLLPGDTYQFQNRVEYAPYQASVEGLVVAGKLELTDINLARLDDLQEDLEQIADKADSERTLRPGFRELVDD